MFDRWEQYRYGHEGGGGRSGQIGSLSTRHEEYAWVHMTREYDRQDFMSILGCT